MAQASACALLSLQPKFTRVSALPDPLGTRYHPFATLPLNPFVTILDAASSISPVFATLTKNTRGGVSHSSNQNPAVLPVPNHRSPVIAPLLALPPVTNQKSRITKSFTIRTYEKRARNSRRIRTSKTQDLKPFRMNTYRKTGEGERVSIPRCIATYQARFRIRVRGV